MNKRLFTRGKSWMLTTGVITALPLLSMAQAPTIQWDITVGASSRDVVTSVALTEDKGYILGGYSNSIADGDKTEGNRGNKKDDYWVVKLNADGKHEWNRTYGGGDVDILNSIRPVKGGYIVGGTSSSNKDGKFEKQEDSKGGSDYWVLKLNTKGDIEWQKTIGGDLNDELAVVIPTSDGGYLVGGTSASPRSGDKSEDSKGVDIRTGNGSDYWIVKLNEKGDIEWDRTIGGSDASRLKDVLEVDDGYILGGYALPGKGHDKTDEGYKAHDYWIVKVSHKGDVMWDRVYGGSGVDHLVSLVAYDNDGFFAAGYSDSPNDKFKNDKPIKGTDYWILKLNREGDYEWDRVIGSEGEDYLYSVSMIDRDILLGGTSGGLKSGHKSEDNRAVNMNDFWVVRLNEKGEVVWDKTLGGNRNEQGGYFYATPDGGYIVAGGSSSDNAFEKSDKSRGEFDYWAIKLQACTPIKTTENKTFCEGSGFSLPDGRVVRAAGTYTSIVKGKTGCDDTVVTVLTQMPVYEELIEDTLCAGGQYTLPDGRIVSNDGYFRCNFRTVNGCDSIIVVSLTFKTIDTIHVASAICEGGSYTLPGGRVVFDEGEYIDEFVTAEGCDSIIVTRLSKDGVDTSVTVFSDELSANSDQGTYQWIDCATNQPIQGATSKNFAPTEQGRYAVKISLNGCEATSSCYDFTPPTNGVVDLVNNKAIYAYPNPSNNVITVDAHAIGNIEQLIVINTLGAIVHQASPNTAMYQVPVSTLPAGMYMVQVQTTSGVSTLRIQVLQ